MNSKPPRLRKERAALLVVDIQERLLPAVNEPGQVVQNAVRLIKAAQLFEMPTLVSEQYPKGLGPTVAEVTEAITDFSPIEKLTFSACGAPGIVEGLSRQEGRQVIVCGIETHVCVTQTCLDLLDHGYHPFIAADAASSREAHNHRIGLERMRDAGVVVASTEMLLFEILERAGTREFKEILRLVK